MVNLHVRSCYSLLRSTLRIDDIVALAVKNHQKAVALCDKNIMFGAMAFYHACQKQQIKSLFALEVQCEVEETLITFFLYAQDDLGYQELMHLSTIINTEMRNPSLNEIVMLHHVLVGIDGHSGYFNDVKVKHNDQEIMAFLTDLKRQFRFLYLAIVNNDALGIRERNNHLKQLCKAVGIKTFALSTTYYAEKEDVKYYELLRCIDEQKHLKDATLDVEYNRYFRNDEELAATYDADDLRMSSWIADNCNVEFKFEKAYLPKYQNRFKVDSALYLQQLCIAGLKKRFNNHVTKPYIERFEYELSIIEKMGYADYFLIVYDFIAYARKHDIYVGPGRGSAAGCLIAFCLGITNVDPIKYGLLFERFLNPERISMPDIDVDFPDNRRDEVISYVNEKYGSKHVSHILTFGTLGARQVIRDVGKAKNIALSEINKLCKMIPSAPKMTLKLALSTNQYLRATLEANGTLRELFNDCLHLEGLPRHTSTHAAGIIISGVDIEQVCPLIRIDDDIYASQFTMEYLEELGLIKMDFLGLRNLTIIDKVVNYAAKNGRNIDIMKIDLNDRKTMEMICAVDTVGVFQLESEGMKNLIRQMQPQRFEEVAALIALFRPGPMENIPAYLKNRKNQSQINYFNDDLKPILKDTYGVMIYQEQIMQVAQKMAGFSLGRADILRKAMSKKKPEELAKMHDSFIAGSLANGYGKQLAEQVFNQIEKFAGYGFNKSHSVAYAMISMQMAYLKCNYPLDFFACLLDSVIGSQIKTSEYIFEARKRKIKILGPSINNSNATYTIINQQIVFPLTGIKNFGANMSTILINDRQVNGIYHDYDEFVSRCVKCGLTRNTIELLIDAGALDEFKYNRSSLKYNLDTRFRYAEMNSENMSLFDDTIVHLSAFKQCNENKAITLEKEKAVLGFYLSEHPITKIRNEIDENLPSMVELNLIKGKVHFVCIVESVKQHRTRNGETMCFIVAADETGTYDIAVMPDLFNDMQQILVRGNYLHVYGKIGDRNSVLANQITLIEKSDYE